MNKWHGQHCARSMAITRQFMTDYDRIQSLLGLCEEYQGHEKTRRALLKYLRTTEYTVTTVPFEMAEQIMETNAMAEDELQAQLAPTEKRIKTANVSAVGAVPTWTPRENCEICHKPGHAATDCLTFMHNEGVCGHWFMHSIGKYKTGCKWGSTCNKKHERPNCEPKAALKNVSSMAIGTLPTNGTAKLQEMQMRDLEGHDLTLMPNETLHWVSNCKIWLQPEHDEETMCSVCDEGHSTITPCENGGGSHSELTKSMGIELTASAVEPDRPFRWVSYAMQVQKDALQVGIVNSMPKRLMLATKAQRRSLGTWNSLYDNDD